MITLAPGVEPETSACLIREEIQQTKRRSKKCMLKSELVPRPELPGPQHDGHMKRYSGRHERVSNHKPKSSTYLGLSTESSNEKESQDSRIIRAPGVEPGTSACLNEDNIQQMRQRCTAHYARCIMLGCTSGVLTDFWNRGEGKGRKFAWTGVDRESVAERSVSLPTEELGTSSKFLKPAEKKMNSGWNSGAGSRTRTRITDVWVWVWGRKCICLPHTAADKFCMGFWWTWTRERRLIFHLKEELLKSMQRRGEKRIFMSEAKKQCASD
ncbi:hypothetical protein K438DRAFT_1786332 [Mycena galopus ATCC 62051]|nr:hypothetical protein K438DRAFT_1786332 [Mycena galopus ATCC 62051]